MTAETLSFTEWMDRLEKVAVTQFGFHPLVRFDSGWRGMYEDGLTPEAALQEDLLNGY